MHEDSVCVGLTLTILIWVKTARLPARLMLTMLKGFVQAIFQLTLWQYRFVRSSANLCGDGQFWAIVATSGAKFASFGRTRPVWSEFGPCRGNFGAHPGRQSDSSSRTLLEQRSVCVVIMRVVSTCACSIASVVPAIRSIAMATINLIIINVLSLSSHSHADQHHHYHYQC